MAKSPKIDMNQIQEMFRSLEENLKETNKTLEVV